MKSKDLLILLGNQLFPLDEIKKLITSKTKMIAITHISNVTGGITPLKKIIDLASSKNIPVLVDGTQGAPHLKLDMQKLGCDFYVISCHKMYGPNGLGILYGKKKWLDVMPPYQGGGGMIDEVKKENITFAESPTKFEAGTMQTAEVVAFSESIKLVEKIGLDKISEIENEVLRYGIDKLKKNKITTKFVKIWFLEVWMGGKRCGRVARIVFQTTRPEKPSKNQKKTIAFPIPPFSVDLAQNGQNLRTNGWSQNLPGLVNQQDSD